MRFQVTRLTRPNGEVHFITKFVEDTAEGGLIVHDLWDLPHAVRECAKECARGCDVNLSYTDLPSMYNLLDLAAHNDVAWLEATDKQHNRIADRVCIDEEIRLLVDVFAERFKQQIALRLPSPEPTATIVASASVGPVFKADWDHESYTTEEDHESYGASASEEPPCSPGCACHDFMAFSEDFEGDFSGGDFEDA